MKTLRQVHFYLGCLFAPLIIYFCASGAWQVFGLNDVPKGEVAPVRSVLHAVSNPHTHSTLPGRDPKTQDSILFSSVSMIAALGMIVTAILGVIMAWQFSNRRKAVLVCLALGLLIPPALLFVTS